MHYIKELQKQPYWALRTLREVLMKRYKTFIIGSSIQYCFNIACTVQSVQTNS